MIKKLQALRAKKGFTLVELIVVIAIIGVLAAILVPTMLGMVTKSRVTSADSTAKGIKDAVDTFLTEADTNGFGLKSDATKVPQITVNVTTAAGGAPQWALTLNSIDGFKSGTSAKWVAETKTVDNTTTRTTAGDSALALLGMELVATFPDMKNAAIIIQLKGGQNCSAVVYTADENDAAKLTGGTSYPTITSGEFPTTFTWDGKTAGISSDGLTVGTAPKVAIGAGSST